MNCTNTRQHISAYFDNELPGEIRAEVAEHVQSCADCTAALSRIRSLSSLARELPDPATSDLWSAIKHELHPPKVSRSVPPVHTISFWSHWRWAMGVAAIAAILLVGFLGWPLTHPMTAHADMSVSISRFVEQFPSDPTGAERILREEYTNQSIEPADAIRLANYKPLAPEKLSDGVTRTKMYLFEMPCCKCIQTLYCRSDGSSLAVFEHVNEDADWFGKRSVVRTNCSQKDVCLVECGGQLAITWKEGKRHVTLVGVKDMDEASRLVPAFADSSS